MEVIVYVLFSFPILFRQFCKYLTGVVVYNGDADKSLDQNFIFFNHI